MQRKSRLPTILGLLLMAGAGAVWFVGWYVWPPALLIENRTDASITDIVLEFNDDGTGVNRKLADLLPRQGRVVRFIGSSDVILYRISYRQNGHPCIWEFSGALLTPLESFVLTIHPDGQAVDKRGRIGFPKF
jgi:hypothetical protein